MLTFPQLVNEEEPEQPSQEGQALEAPPPPYSTIAAGNAGQCSLQRHNTLQSWMVQFGLCMFIFQNSVGDKLVLTIVFGRPSEFCFYLDLSQRSLNIKKMEGDFLTPLPTTSPPLCPPMMKPREAKKRQPFPWWLEGSW